MNLLDLAVKITCDDRASGEVAGIGSKITSALGTAAKVGGAAVAALGTTTIALGKTALDSYANYEQLVGGIDTLFKDSSAKMQQYAANAYRTAGVSANRYMEISTSFAASLINSLGGDTAAAANMANMAIEDMSDNANKMGTSLEVVQEAYMSLSRGNYEMLDSLKLGYGGTKTELERLLSDAEDIAAAQGEVRDFSVNSYADIVEAIHLVQDEMGITGTTAKEAATTIEGSVNMAKAAWDNWLAGLGNENADMEGLTSQLVDSVATAGENIIPRVGQIMTTLGKTIASYAPGVGLYLRNALIDLLPEAIQSPMREAFLGLDDIIANAGSVVEYLQTTFGPGIQRAMELVGPIVQQVVEFFDHMGTQIQDVLGPALDFLGQAFTDAMTALQPWIEPLGNVAQIFGNILVAAIAAFIYALGGVMEIFAGVTAVIQDFDNFMNGQPSVIGTVIQGIITWFQQLPGNIASLLGSVISSVVSWAGQMVTNGINAASQFVSNVINFLASLPGQLVAFFNGIISNVLTWVSQMAQQASNAASQFASNVINGLAAIPGQVVSIGSDIIGGLVDGVVGAAGSLIDAVGGAVNDALDWAKNLLGIASPSKVFREIGQYSMQGMALGIDDDAGLVAGSTDDALRGMVSSARSVDVPAQSSQAQGTAAVLLDEVRKLRDDIKNMKIYLNGRTLVGGIADDMDKELGRRAAWSATR